MQFSPWHVTEGADGCPTDRPWGVVNETDQSVEGCHASEDEANAQVDALYANENDAGAAEVAFTAVLAVEGFDTGDGRVLEEGGWSDARHFPLPLWIQTDQPEWGGHAGAFIGGRIEGIERAEDGRRLIGTGFVSVADERGQWAEGQIRSRNLRFVSIDVGDADIEYEVREVDADGWPIDVLARFSNYDIAGATVCGSPAITFACIWLEGMDPPDEFAAPLPDAPERVAEPTVVEGEDAPLLIIASARDDAGNPPADWFEDPDLDELTHVTVTPDGYVYGHLAPWGECHIGMPGCVTAPRSPSDYAHFRTGEVLAHCDCDDEGDGDHLVRIATGPLTLGTDHAARGLSAQEAAWHYDHTGSAVADVAVGEDAFGIWIAGAVREHATPAQVRDLRAADVSGDWRRLGGSLELVAVLAANVAGFSIPRQPQAHLVASAGRMLQTSLLAPVGTPQRPRFGHEDPRILSLHSRLLQVERDLRRLASIADPLQAMAALEIVASMQRHPTRRDDDVVA